MRRMDYQEGCEKLREVGFTAPQIENLCRLRSVHVEQEMHRSLVSQCEAKHENWFEKLMRKILLMCRYSAECEASIWMYDHFPY